MTLPVCASERAVWPEQVFEPTADERPDSSVAAAHMSRHEPMLVGHVAERIRGRLSQCCLGLGVAAPPGGTSGIVYLAGLRIPDEDVRDLIKLVDEPTRSSLEKALALESEVVAVTIEDRKRILWALDDVRTDALAELRGVLLQEHGWRSREGLV